MKVQVQLFSNLRDCLPQGSEVGKVVLDIPEGTTLGRFLESLDLDQCMTGRINFLENINAWQIRVNDKFTNDLDLILQSGDSVIVFPHMAGGVYRRYKEKNLSLIIHKALFIYYYHH
ncbi:MAG TPA: MoaD/ThiS family protein [Anaerolineae bacterium]|nr:MoaD/ThiS family protein [Anaerolineae bacterium]